MIDIHTHILPNIDDGAKDVAEALKMTEYLEEQGVETAVCTPHFDSTKISLEEFIGKREKAFLAIKDSKITLISGSETLYHDFLYQYSDLTPICINNSKYLLLELPYKEVISEYEFQSITKFMNLFNIIPVIAHIERYDCLWKNKKNIRRLMNLGCLIQVNANTIIDTKKRKRAVKYIKKGLIDLIGSDCHNMTKRPPNLKDAFVIIEEELGTSYCDLLNENADSIVNGIILRATTVRFI
ncbi:MAG: hypothetical protein GX237_06405 [Clostridiales bacterium]|nr:hypothetical protein [Clostridiales bacterium]